MKNLKCLVNMSYVSRNIASSQFLTIATLDYNNNIFKRKGYVFVYKEGDIFAISNTNGICELLISIKDISSSDLTPVAFFFNSICMSLIIILRGGNVLSIALNDHLLPVEKEAQCVGSISAGLQAAVLSPDAEHIVLLDSDNNIILMNNYFDIVKEISLFSSEKGEQEMINVGWGKKETQFHGSEGKAAAKAASEQTVAENVNPSEMELKPNITWRGDSSLFAVNYWCSETNNRSVKIFNNSGVLQCTSELLSGLESVISWKPSGNLIALAQNLPNKHVVCFMEKNGLRHGEFLLPSNIKVEELSWNCESSILSVVCKDENSGGSCVLLYTTSNYHWYMKQRLELAAAAVSLRWDDVIGNLAHILLVDGNYFLLQWTWAVDHSEGEDEDDLATVAVIDSCDLKLSAFKRRIVPPPMCADTITLPSSVLQVMFLESGASRVNSLSPNDVCVYLSNGSLAFIRGMETTPHLHSIVPVQSAGMSLVSPASMSHWLWLSKQQLICVVCTSSFQLCLVQIEDQAATVVKTSELPDAVLTISHCGVNGALIQLSSGALLEYRDGSLSQRLSLPEPCVYVRVMREHVFSRAHNNHLYVDGELIANNVSSYFCLSDFLLMTLTTHQLCVTTADSDFKTFNAEDEKAGTVRKLERGSSLVVAVGHSVVLQMPRGNLETIQPRALTLVTAAKFLDAGDYMAAAQLLRRQRIDLNLLVDHNPSMFLLSVPRFVSQVRDPQWLSVFLAELAEHDVTHTMYAGVYNNKQNCSAPLSNKVVRVCTAMIEAMSQTPEDKEFFQQPILSALVRAGRLGDAIALADSEQALNYLILLIDVNQLYEEALAAYNLEKALKIAGKSLKDPKEYVAYLNKLKGMDEAYMRFTIDKRLRKPQSALRNLAQCKNYTDECLQYVKDTQLFSLAIELFRNEPYMYSSVCTQYGHHLLDKRKLHEAGVMFRRGMRWEEAINAFTKAGSWRQCLRLARQQYYNKNKMEELQESVYSVLHGSQQFTEAAQLCSHLGQWEKAISCYIEARDWSQASFLCTSHQLTHLIDSAVKPALLESTANTLSDLKSKREQLEKLSARLVVVRQRKANQENYFDPMNDIQSDTSSLSSFSTSSAGTRTTKNTRKAQRKLWSLKEGNPREEQALLFNITELVQNTERLTGETHTLCLALADFDLEREAKNLHSTMSSALEQLEPIRQTVWPTSAVKKTGSDAEAIDPTSIDLQIGFPPSSCISPSWKLDIYT